MFHVRTIFPEWREAESATHPSVPTHLQVKNACNLFGRFFANRPMQFRGRLDFVAEERLELEWMTGAGGGAFAALYASGDPVSMSMLFPDELSDSDREALNQTGRKLLEPILEADTERLMLGPSYPLMVTLLVPGRDDLREILDILHVALATYYFGRVAALRVECARESVPPHRLSRVIEWDLNA
jgi:hypothetical protein